MNSVLAVTDNSLKNNYYYALSTDFTSNPPKSSSQSLPLSHTGIADSGASGIYFARNAPVSNLNPTAPTVAVRVANGLPVISVASATLASVSALPLTALQGHVMPSFPHTLIGLGAFADQGCKIVFTKTAVSVIQPDGHSILEGWREETGPKLWRFPLLKQPTDSLGKDITQVDNKPTTAPRVMLSRNNETIQTPVQPLDTSPTPPLSPIGKLDVFGMHLTTHPIHGLEAMDTNGQSCFVSYMFGVNRALSVTAKSTLKPFDTRILDLPSVGALVGFYHACLGFPVKQTWLDAIKAGNLDKLDGLTYSNAAKYCPDADETIKGHMAQQRQNVRSTKPKRLVAPPLPRNSEMEQTVQHNPTNQVFIYVYPISKLYTDDTGRFPVRARSGNQYVMIAYHADGNLILQQPFQTKSDKHRIAAYNAIMTRLVTKGLTVDLQILDNEASAEYKNTIVTKWKATFQLVPPDMHRRNRAERAIRTFKDHFLSILAGVDPAYPPYLWDLLLPQAELTFNLLRQATLNPKISAWEYFNGPFDFNKTPLVPVGCRVLIHAKPATRRSWDFCAKDGFYIGPAMDSYRCFKLVKSDTKSQVISDTVEFRHAYRTIPAPTVEDKITNSLQVMTSALKDAAPPTSITQFQAIDNLRELFEAWKLISPADPASHNRSLPGRSRAHPSPPPMDTPPELTRSRPVTSPASPPHTGPRTPPVPRPVWQATPRRLEFTTLTPPRVALNDVQPPRVEPMDVQPPRGVVLPRVVASPIANRTRSHTGPLALFTECRPYHEQVTYFIPTAKANRPHPMEELGFAGLVESMHLNPSEKMGFANLCEALAVLDPATGNLLEHRQLRKDPRYKATWDKSFANELGRLCQGIGRGSAPASQRIAGTDTFRIIAYLDIPEHKRKEICHTKVVCEYRPTKSDPNRTRITIGGNRICYPGDVGTNTASLELVKLLLNSVLSRKGARFSTIDLNNFYLDTPMPDKEYVRIKLSDILEEFVTEYNLAGKDRDGWIYFEIGRGCYGLPQAGILANNLLRSRLVAEGFYEALTTPGLWKHKWRPIQFCLIVDDFGVEYVGIEHFNHLLNLLKKYHGVQVNMAGDKLAGIDIKWDYANKRCRISMPGYIENLLRKFKHPIPRKRRLSPYKCLPIVYGATNQLTPLEDSSEPLSNERKLRIQEIVGSLLYYARAVDNKLLVALSAIAARQASATVATEQSVNLLLDYVATYPNDGIVFRASNMILCAHADAGFLNETNACSRAGAHIFLSEDDPFPRFNGAVLAIAQIIKFVMASAAEAELAALFITAREMIPHRQTLIEMGWPQPKTPIQTDNSTAAGFTNNTIVARKSKMMDMRLRWLRCRESQNQYRYYWDAGAKNWADYYTKHHPDTYHEAHRHTHAGVWNDA